MTELSTTEAKQARILHLTLKKKWFDMILSGEKPEEYRDIKMYWATRLCNGFPQVYGIDTINPDFKDFDVVEFKNGYSKESPVMQIEWKGVELGIGKPKWGASGNKQFIIKIGKIISTKNILQSI